MTIKKRFLCFSISRLKPLRGLATLFNLNIYFVLICFIGRRCEDYLRDTRRCFALRTLRIFRLSFSVMTRLNLHLTCTDSFITQHLIQSTKIRCIWSFTIWVFVLITVARNAAYDICRLQSVNWQTLKQPRFRGENTEGDVIKVVTP